MKSLHLKAGNIEDTETQKFHKVLSSVLFRLFWQPDNGGLVVLIIFLIRLKFPDVVIAA